ncbi:hypothetical protein HanXRQr2_Chr06g0278531 [Helianthus annuus]|uniref:Uncharacterized protein n=1 Tax=Helianthus annuus TaxID=4232 RepID=A0A9K3IW49_HELAN|nr:uncharacterized protein LOC110942010 isoform X2 [Helianthus annuus]KAF5804047.1 hypothetical protein HanXRQr2_Chr06g0278531 [Helianthus annuus]
MEDILIEGVTCCYNKLGEHPVFRRRADWMHEVVVRWLYNLALRLWSYVREDASHCDVAAENEVDSHAKSESDDSSPKDIWRLIDNARTPIYFRSCSRCIVNSDKLIYSSLLKTVLLDSIPQYFHIGRLGPGSTTRYGDRPIRC